ncbi:MAG: glycosyltransferase family 2 protein [Acidimicrobiales bacterium]
MNGDTAMKSRHGDADLTSGIRCSVIVVNFNEREVLLDCVESLCAAVSDQDEIIVVDNGSSDGSADAVAATFPQVRLVRLPQNRYIFGLNDGLAVARGRYVAFCNNDMLVEAAFVEAALPLFDEANVFAVCARVIDRRGREQGTRTAGVWKHGLLFYEPLAHSEVPTACFFAVGGQAFFRRDLLVALGSIDELLWPMYHEDIELSYRAWKAGYRVAYAPESVCHHLGGHTSGKVFTKVQLRSFVRQNEILTVWKDVTDPWMLFEHLFFLPIRLAVAVIRRDQGTLRGFGSALGRLPRVLRARRQAARDAVLSDRDVLARVSVESVSRPLRAVALARPSRAERSS